MRVKGDIRRMNCLDRLYKGLLNTYYRIKGMGVFALVPFFIVFVLIPGTVFLVMRYVGKMDLVYTCIVESCEYLIPLFSVFHIFFILYHFTEEPGNEVLYISDRNKLPMLLLPYILYELMLLPQFFVYTGWFGQLWLLYARLLAIFLFYPAFVYFAAFMFRGISVGVIGVLLYTIGKMVAGQTAIIYLTEQQAPIRFFVQHLLPYIGASVLLGFLGVFANRHFKRW